MSETRNPWTILQRETRYENPWIRLDHFDVLNPSGGKGIYGKVHFKNVAVGVFPLDEEQNTWLVGQYRFTLDQYSWEMPEGGGPHHEDPLMAAQRELEEETGMQAAKWSTLLTMHLSNSVSDEKAIVFLARELSMGKSHPEETEDLQVKKIPFEEVFQMVEQGTITDAMTVAAVYKIKLMLVNGQIS